MEVLAVKQGDEMGAGSSPRPEEAAEEDESQESPAVIIAWEALRAGPPLTTTPGQGTRAPKRLQQCLWVDFYFKECQ